jgi:hypothetical protein
MTTHLNGKEPGSDSAKSEGFDLSRFRLTQNFVEKAGVKKKLTTIPIRKPNRQEYVRVRLGSEWRLETAVIELKEENETYLVAPELWSELPGEIVPKVLFMAITRQNVPLLWPIKMPGEDGRMDNWNRSALDAAELATRKWIRLTANRSLGAYDIFESTGDLPEPEWPDDTLQEIVKIAFRGLIIETMDHPVIRRLRGGL